MKKILIALAFILPFLSCSEDDLQTELTKERYLYNFKNEKQYYSVNTNMFCIGFTKSDSTKVDSVVSIQRKVLLMNYGLTVSDSTIIIDTANFSINHIDAKNVIIAYTNTPIDYTEAVKLSSSLLIEPTVTYANPFLLSKEDNLLYGISDIFYVKLQSPNTIEDLKKLLIPGIVNLNDISVSDDYWLQVSKIARKDALDASNQFFDTRKFKYCSPIFIKLKKAED